MSRKHQQDERRIMRESMTGAGMPTEEEIAREKEKYLREQGCSKCGHDDPVNLSEFAPITPNCNAIQTPPGQGVVLCEKCSKERPTYREKILQKAEKRNESPGLKDITAVVFYECGASDFVKAPEMPIPPTHHRGGDAKIRCRCGEKIEEIEYLDE